MVGVSTAGQAGARRVRARCRRGAHAGARASSCGADGRWPGSVDDLGPGSGHDDHHHPRDHPRNPGNRSRNPGGPQPDRARRGGNVDRRDPAQPARRGLEEPDHALQQRASSLEASLDAVRTRLGETKVNLQAAIDRLHRARRPDVHEPRRGVGRGAWHQPRPGSRVGRAVQRRRPRVPTPVRSSTSARLRCSSRRTSTRRRRAWTTCEPSSSTSTNSTTRSLRRRRVTSSISISSAASR